MCIFGLVSNILEMQNEEIKKFFKTDRRAEHDMYFKGREKKDQKSHLQTQNI